MALLEVAVALPIVSIALGMMVQMMAAGAGLRESGREQWSASSAAQDVVERMRNEDFRDIFRLYNADPFDDPGGPGTAPGNRFAVPGMVPSDPAPDAMVGEILLASVNVGTAVVPLWQMREDLEDVALGTPRDLNGDSLIDDADHSADYTILPVVVRLRWRGRMGAREFTLHTVLSELR